MREPVLRMKDVSKVYRVGDVEVVALHGVSLELSAGEFIVLLRKAKDRIQVVSIPLRFQNLGEQNAASAAMLVQSGDILFLPPSKISDVESFMRSIDSILSPLLAVERGVMYWPVFKQALQGTSGEILVQ